MSQLPVTPPPARTWQDIEQAVTTRSMSTAGKRRRTFSSLRLVGGLLLLGVCAWGGWEIYATWRQNPAKIASPVPARPVREITLRTDGVLTREWAVATLALPVSAGLMELDLDALRDRLLASGQVRTAVLARKFPDTLSIVVEERSPVLRVMVRDDASGAGRRLLVARDGMVYDGNGYTDSLLATLPWLDGVRLTREGARYAPVAGMEPVSELLGTALVSTPGLYRGFRVVSLSRFASDGIITVKSTAAESIAFGTRENFYRQLARLDYVIGEVMRQPTAAPLKSINLAVGGRQVPVSFDTAALTASARPAAPVARPLAVAPARPTRPAPVSPTRPNQFQISANLSRDI